MYIMGVIRDNNLYDYGGNNHEDSIRRGMPNKISGQDSPCSI